jgi:hypothetical protein
MQRERERERERDLISFCKHQHNLKKKENFAYFLKFNKSTEILKNSEKLHVIKRFLSLAALATILVCYKMTKKDV